MKFTAELPEAQGYLPETVDTSSEACNPSDVV